MLGDSTQVLTVNNLGFTGTTSINCGTLAFSGNYNGSNVKFCSGGVGSAAASPPASTWACSKRVGIQA
jgi:hypothetical protein